MCGWYHSGMNDVPEIFIRTDSKRHYEEMLTRYAMQQQKHAEFFMSVYDNRPFLNFLECEKYAAPYSVYVIADDDVIPGHEDTIANLCQKLREHPEVGIMGLAPQPAYTPDHLQAVSETFKIEELSPRVWKCDYTSGLIAVRHGILKDYGDRPDNLKGIGDARILATACRKAGKEVAIWMDDWFYHIGEGKGHYWNA